MTPTTQVSAHANLASAVGLDKDISVSTNVQGHISDKVLRSISVGSMVCKEWTVSLLHFEITPCAKSHVREPSHPGKLALIDVDFNSKARRLP